MLAQTFHLHPTTFLTISPKISIGLIMFIDHMAILIEVLTMMYTCSLLLLSILRG
jgi:hypothetical protein